MRFWFDGGIGRVPNSYKHALAGTAYQPTEIVSAIYKFWRNEGREKYWPTE